MVGAFGAFLFILIQLILLMDFVHSLSESWHDKKENENPKLWSCGASVYIYHNSLMDFVIRNMFYPENTCDFLILI